MYNDKVLNHFANPKNMGEISDASGIGHTGNPSDGDKITIYIKVEQEKIVDIKFKTFGCAAAIAASSMLTELAKGKKLKEALNITNDDVAEALGGLPPQKLKCSNIAADALHEAIEDYKSSKPQMESCPVKEELTTNTCASIPVNHGLLTKEQIQRYLRHIIMPQISGPGQKKIIDSKVSVYTRTLEDSELMLYYMVAMGVEDISLYAKESRGRGEAICEHVRDLNPNLDLKVFDSLEKLDPKTNDTDCNILIGNKDHISKVKDMLCLTIPSIIISTSPWSGVIGVCHDEVSLIKLIEGLPEIEDKEFEMIGHRLSNSFAGVFAATELIKLRLSIGSILRGAFHYNLLESEFGSLVQKSSESPLEYEQLEKKLSELRVLIIGAGGLGSPVALALTKAGVGQIGSVDYDKVEISNLNRQVLHSTSRIGKLKVESAKEVLCHINPGVNIKTYPVALNKDNAAELIEDYDIIVDGLDNIPTRYILNDACYKANKPFVEAGVLTFYGQITSIIPRETPCYRCLYPEREDSSNIPGCSELGVLGTVPGLLGILQAVEVIKLAVGFESRLNGGLLMYDALEREFNLIPLLRSPSCKLCGKE